MCAQNRKVNSMQVPLQGTAKLQGPGWNLGSFIQRSALWLRFTVTTVPWNETVTKGDYEHLRLELSRKCM